MAISGLFVTSCVIFGPVFAPFTHGRAHRQHLIFKLRAGFAGEHVQFQSYGVVQLKVAVFAGDHQGGRFLAGAPEQRKFGHDDRLTGIVTT